MSSMHGSKEDKNTYYKEFNGDPRHDALTVLEKASVGRVGFMLPDWGPYDFNDLIHHPDLDKLLPRLLTHYTELAKQYPVVHGFQLKILQTLSANSTTKPTKTSVLQSWVQYLTLMQQSVLLGAIRGPDGISKYSAAKYLLRWYRRCILISAFDRCVLDNPVDQRGGSFTGPSIPAPAFDDKDQWLRENKSNWQPLMETWVSQYFIEFDSYPAHFTKHFMMACQILGYKHPDKVIRKWWFDLYVRLVKDQHLNIETEEQMQLRLGDDREKWTRMSEPSTRK